MDDGGDDEEASLRNGGDRGKPEYILIVLSQLYCTESHWKSEYRMIQNYSVHHKHWPKHTRHKKNSPFPAEAE